jgi:MarR family transcriptional regulator, organic hydroperoxide resistance regulator
MKPLKQQRQAGFLMAKIRQVSGRLSERMLKDYGIEINSAQGRVMFALWQQNGIPINDLAQKTQLKKSTLTSMLDRLEKMGYVKREHSKKDRRKILINRTDKDKALETRYIKLSQEITEIFYQGFKESEIERFEQNLAKILENLTEFERGLK